MKQPESQEESRIQVRIQDCGQENPYSDSDSGEHKLIFAPEVTPTQAQI